MLTALTYLGASYNPGPAQTARPANPKAGAKAILNDVSNGESAFDTAVAPRATRYPGGSAPAGGESKKPPLSGAAFAGGGRLKQLNLLD